MDRTNAQEYAAFVRGQPAHKYQELILYVLSNNLLNEKEEKEFLKALWGEQKTDKFFVTEDDALLTDKFFEDYEYCRTVGMPLDETAKVLGIPTERMERLLKGTRLRDKKRYMRLLEIEQRAPLKMKLSALGRVYEGVEKDSNVSVRKMNFALKVLEKLYPDKWGEKVTTTVALAPLNAEECESRAAQAAIRLEELREERAKRKNRG